MLKPSKMLLRHITGGMIWRCFDGATSMAPAFTGE